MKQKILPGQACAGAPRCDQPVLAKGLCSLHYSRQARGIPLDHPKGTRRKLRECLDCGVAIAQGMRCDPCSRPVANRAWAARNRAKTANYNKSYRAEHATELKAKQTAKWAEHREARRPVAVAAWLATPCYKCGRAIDAPALIPKRLQARRQCEPCKRRARD